MSVTQKNHHMQYYIKDKEWEQIIKCLHQQKGLHTFNVVKLKNFVEAIYYMAKSGCQWRLLSDYYGNWRAVHRRFRRWSLRGVWNNLFNSVQHYPDMELVMIDSTIVRAHACSAGFIENGQAEQALGRSKSGFSTKIHTLVDGLGNPLKFIFTAGQRHNITQAPPLVETISNAFVVADKAYDSQDFVGFIEERDCVSVIPCKKNRKVQRSYDEYLYKERQLIECFFGKMKNFRHVFSRFDKTALSFLSFLHFVSTFIWLR